MTTLVYLLSAYLLHDAELYFNIFLAIWQIDICELGMCFHV